MWQKLQYFLIYFQYESFLDSPPQAPILEGVFSEFLEFSQSPPPSKLQKFGEGGGIERVIPGLVCPLNFVNCDHIFWTSFVQTRILLLFTVLFFFLSFFRLYDSISNSRLLGVFVFFRGGLLLLCPRFFLITNNCCPTNGHEQKLLPIIWVHPPLHATKKMWLRILRLARNSVFLLDFSQLWSSF